MEKRLQSGNKAKSHKIARIAGIEFKYRTGYGLIKKVWREASIMGNAIRNLDKKRQALIKAYRDLDWKYQREEYEKHDPQDPNNN